jgi:hypothetical protein
MIHVRGELCWSPRPPEDYGKGSIGYGPSCRGDMPLWNLVYISYPMVDQYLAPGANALLVTQRMPFGALGHALATMKGDNCRRLFPEMRGWLQEDPTTFVERVSRMDAKRLSYLPMVAFNPRWIETVTMRAADIAADIEARSWADTRSVLDGILRHGKQQKE